MKHLYVIAGAFMFLLSPVPAGSFPFRRSELDPIPESSSDNVECFLDFMELWVMRRQINGLLLWLSQVLHFPVGLSSLDRANHLISGCRYALDMDSNGNVVFRAHYTACNVQTQNGFRVLEIHMVKKTSAGGGHSDRYLMRCPAMTEALGRERVRCDPNYVQVSRPMPLGSSDDQEWSLLFHGELLVSVDDASLMGVEVEISNLSVTVRGQRGPLLDTKEFLGRQMDVLPLWMARGFYAYSLEASCPLVSQHPGDEVTLHIPKQRMGLVKRGSYVTETLTLRNIASRPSVTVTVTENRHFLMITVPAGDVLQRQDCNTEGNNDRGIQVFYSIDLMLEFSEVAHPMNWTLENYYECTALPPGVTQPRPRPTANAQGELSADVTAHGKATEQEMASLATTAHTGRTTASIPASPDTQGAQDGKYPVTSPGLKGGLQESTGQLAVPTEPGEKQLGGQFDIGISGSGDDSATQHFHQDRTEQPLAIGRVTPESFTGYSTVPNKLPMWSTAVTGPPNKIPLPQEQRNIPSNQGLQSGIYNENKPRFTFSNMLPKLVDWSSPVGGQNMTFDKNITEKNTRQNMYSPLTKVTQPGGPDRVSPVIYSPEAKQKNTSKSGHQLPWNSQPVSGNGKSTSPQRPKDDATPWESLRGETLSELLEETTRDGLLSPVYRGRKEIKFADRIGSERPSDATRIPMGNHDKKQAGDLRYMSGTKGDQPTAPLDDKSLLPSNYLESSDWTPSSSLPEKTLNHTARELEIIGSAEQLLLST